MMDYCYDQILEVIQKLDEKKSVYNPVLFEISLLAANLLIQNCLLTKRVDGFINKMFMMADGYLNEHNKVAPQKLNRNYINATFAIFKKKKEAQASLIQ